MRLRTHGLARIALAICLVASRVGAEEPTREDPPREASWQSRGGVAFSGFTGVTNSNAAQLVNGLRLAAIVGPLGSWRWGMAVSVEEGINNGLTGDYADRRWVEHRLYERTYVGGRGGVLVGWGAPWSDRTRGQRIFGVTFEVGGAGGSYGSSAYFTPYGQTSIVLQVPTRIALQPWVGASGVFLVDQFHESVQMAMLDFGLAWRAW